MVQQHVTNTMFVESLVETMYEIIWSKMDQNKCKTIIEEKFSPQLMLLFMYHFV